MVWTGRDRDFESLELTSGLDDVPFLEDGGAVLPGPKQWGFI